MMRLARSLAESMNIKNERVITAVGSIPRDIFVDEAFSLRAFSDDALPIGWGQTISKVSTVLRMTDLLDPSPEEKVLEIGTGSGFQLAALALLCKSVYSVERVGALAVRAKDLMNRLGLFGVHIKTADGSKGWSQHAPYDKIIVTAAALSGKVPEPLLEQLAIGGRLVVPVEEDGGQVLKLVLRESEDLWREHRLDRVKFVPLVEGLQKRGVEQR